MLEDRISKIHDMYSVIDQFRKDYPNHYRGGENKARLYAKCPFHNDTGPSMVIDRDGFRCFSASCGVNGDIIEYVMLRDHCSKKDAIEMLANGLLTSTPVQHQPRPKFNYVNVDMSYILRFHHNMPQAMPWFQHRAVGERSGHHHKLGMWPDFYWDFHGKGEAVNRFTCPRYSIPNIRNGFDKLGNRISIGMDVNFRRDDAAALRILKGSDRSLMKRIGEEIAERKKMDAKDITWEDMLDDCFGPKYWRKGSATRMFNGNLVVTALPDGTYQPARLSSILIVEGEIDAMSLTEAGFMAVAVKYSNGVQLTQPLSGVGHIYVIKDRDKDKVGYNGQVTNGGRDNAMRLYEHLKNDGRENVTIIEAPAGFKDANDVIVKGDVKQWLMKYGLTPRPNEFFAGRTGHSDSLPA